MASTMTSSSLVQCPKPFPSPLFSPKNYTILRASSAHNLRFPGIFKVNKIAICAASSSAAGTGSSNSDYNPYEVLGVSPVEGFDMVKAAYAKKKKDAERRGDEATAIELEKAYDKIMMAQLTKRKKGETFGSFKYMERISDVRLNTVASQEFSPATYLKLLNRCKEVSKDIRYADKLPIVPWGPRPSKSDAKDIKINIAISAVFTAWIFIQRNAEYKPLQFLAFAFVYRIFEKLKAFEPAVSPTFTEEGEDEGRMLRMGKRLLRSLSLVFGCIAVASLGYTGILNLIEVAGGYIPRFLYNNQELFITASTALMLYIVASFYR